MRAFAGDSTRKILLRSIFVLACTMLPSILAGQQTPPASETVLRATTRLVLVDAVVVDKAGKPITNLTEKDFTVLEDGHPQKIAAFSAHQPVAPKALPPILEPHVTTNRPETRQMEGTVGVLLLDGLNTPPRNQVFVRQQMLKFLADHFDPSYKIAVLALTDKLVMLQDFTSDPVLLKAALDGYVAQVPHLAHNNVDILDISRVTTGSISRDTAMVTRAAMMERGEQEEEEFKRDLRVPVTVAALEDIARYMSGQPGRKALLWFSEGFPISLGGYPSGSTNQLQGNPLTGPAVDPFEGMEQPRTYSDQIRQTTNLLNEAHIAIYAIDARGLSTMSDFTRSGLDEFGGLTLGTNANDAIAKETFQRASTEDTLEQAAVDTGGQYFHDRNDIDQAISLSLQGSGSYYMLGYYPSQKNWDGRFRQIKVSIDRAGAHVLHRSGYFAVDPEDWRKGGHDKDFSAALATGTLPSTQVLFMARALPPARNADVNVEFVVDPTTIQFQTAQDGPYCNLKFEVQAFTPEGKLVTGEVQTAEAALSPKAFERVQKQGLPMHVPVTLPVGHYNLRLGVRDNLTGLFGTAELPIEVSANP